MPQSYSLQRIPKPATGVLGPSSFFPTTWPNTENPVSMGGIWTQGADVGVDWQNTKSVGGTPGIALATAVSAGFNDCISTVQGQGFSTTKHYSQLTVNKVAGYTPPDSQEIELLGLFTITANSAKGYEMDFAFGVNVQPVRWNGALGDFTTTVFTLVSGTPFQASDGDVIKTVFDSTSGSPVFIIFLGGVEQVRYTDTTAGKITSGFPGMGFFVRTGAGVDLTKYCNKGFDCGNA